MSAVRGDVRRRDRLAGPVLLAYWLVLVGGLALFSAIRLDEPAALAPLWAGAILGTTLGQALALRNLRLWIALLVGAGVALFGIPILAAFVDHPLLLWMAFGPAMVCGWASLSDRLGLLAFWFPAVVWMLSVLDRTDGTSSATDTGAAVLLAALAVLFLAFLRTREYRRVGLWRSVAHADVVGARSVAVLREAPGRSIARIGWVTMVGALTFGVTAWLAPHLWQIEQLAGHTLLTDGDLRAAGAAAELPCCPIDEDIEGARIREYFDLGRAHDGARRPRPGIDCFACTNGAAHSGTLAWSGTVAGAATPRAIAIPPSTAALPAAEGAPAPSVAPPPIAAPASPPSTPAPSTVAPPSPAIAQPPSPPIAQPSSPPIAPPPPASAPSVASSPPQEPPAPAPAPSATPSPRPSHAPPRRAERDADLLRWLLTLAAGALLFQAFSLGLRPLRRALLLRHLRRPFWAESVDQRVSNSWQLALVGLRDAGWRSGDAEPPRELARRVGADEMERCATILERARHGLGVDAGDLDEMARSADSAYQEARRRLGVAARVVAWLRWPLT